jgi:hypothetical protein
LIILLTESSIALKAPSVSIDDTLVSFIADSAFTISNLVVLISFLTSATIESISFVEFAVSAASFLISSATTANAINSIGMNMHSGSNPLSGTNYTFDETGKIIELPYHIYPP